jgi:amino acid adenylation domain-containing protein
MSVMEISKAAQTISLTAYLEASAERFPQRTAIVDPDGGLLSYQDLNERAARVANFLKERGIAAGDRVGLLLPKSSVTLTAIFGILKARAAYVPVDYSAPGARVASIFKDCEVRAIFTDSAGIGLLEKEYGSSLPETVVICGGGTASVNGSVFSWDAVLGHPPLRETSVATPQDLAYILYTSGSTGLPKGVMLSQENATSFVDWCSSVFSPTEHDRFSSHAPFHFDLSILDIYLSIKHGASLHIVSEELGKNPRELAQFIADRRLTIWYSTPSILALLAQFGNLSALDCSSLRMVFFAGEVFPVRHLKALTGLWPHPRYFNLYGPTETNVCTFAEVPSSIPEDRTEPYPIGPACSHCAPLVLDPEKVVVRAGEEGLLYISGPSVFQGYWNRPKENAAAFLERNGTRWYCTGDVVREESQEGFIYVGRRDRMVKRRGYRIELDDIECALYRHPGIREAGVVASLAGGEHTKIVAYLVAGSEPKPGVIAMKMFCSQNLPAYMNPDSFVFVEALPRTSTNKIDYRSLLASVTELALSQGQVNGQK